MKTLQQQYSLSHEVSITIPSTLGTDERCNETLLDNSIEVVQNNLSELFGGTTTYKAEGTYVSNDGDLVKEAVTIVTAMADELSAEDIHQVIELAEFVKLRHDQECVALKVDGTLYLI